jgi:serine/threonine protein phosphatase PrpC
VQLNVETITGEFKPGMQLLLCSDGLTEEVDDGSHRTRAGAPVECSPHRNAWMGWSSAALDGGGSDNVTVVLVRSH